jgi:hypothetical protein
MKQALVFLCLLPTLALAQTDSGTIRILVGDGSAAPVSEAQVRLTNVSTGVVTIRETGEEGYAIFSPIVRGAYVAEITKAGFQQTRVTDLQLDVDERKMVRVTLQVASVSQTIEVSAASDIVHSEQASLGQVIRGAVAVELPLAARRYTDLALLVPGATESTVLTTTRGPGWFVVNGNYQAQNNFIIDGVDNNQGTTNAQALPGYRPNRGPKGWCFLSHRDRSGHQGCVPEQHHPGFAFRLARQETDRPLSEGESDRHGRRKRSNDQQFRRHPPWHRGHPQERFEG